MDRRNLLRSVSAVLAMMVGAIALCSPVAAQTTEAPLAVVAADTREHVVLETTGGNIVIALDPAAPVTASNFLKYVDDKRLDGTDFYRGMVVAPGLGLIQGGTQNAPDRILPPIAHEPTSQTGLSHTDGAVSMARFDPGSATGDFFIIVGNVTSLDASAADPGFAVFGHVIDGMDLVRTIMAAPKSPTEGEGFMRGQMLDPRVRIISARRVVTADDQPH